MLFKGLSFIDHKYVEEAAADASAEKSHGKKILRRPFLAAAIIAVMLVLSGFTYVVLTGSEWFKGFFSGRIEQELSPGQTGFVDHYTQVIGQSVTVDGFTLTVEAVIADSHNAYIMLRLQAPDGTVLDQDDYYSWPRRTEDGKDLEREFYKADDPSLIYGGGTMENIEDEDPLDNSCIILFSLRQSGSEMMPALEEGVLYKLHLTDLQYWDEETETSVLLVEDGVWDFDIVFESLNDDVVEMVTEPVPASFNEFSIEVTSFKLRTMSAEATYSGREDEKGILLFVDSAVVLKDGTRVPIIPRVFGPGGEAGFSLSSPVVLDEVDYVELRDGTRIPME